MKIDIHRHAADRGTADRVVRNLFHDQVAEMESGNYYSLGLHPWHVSAETMQSDVELIRQVSGNSQIIAIGETGLDKAINTPIEIQKKAFESQIKIAGYNNKPMIIHCVRAYQEILQYRIHSKHKKPWIIHWFNASLETGLQLIDKGFYLSFGHMLFNEKSKVFHAFSNLPIEKIFFETDDAGYSIDEVYCRASSLLNWNSEKLEGQLMSNFYNCFGINP